MKSKLIFMCTLLIVLSGCSQDMSPKDMVDTGKSVVDTGKSVGNFFKGSNAEPVTTEMESSSSVKPTFEADPCDLSGDRKANVIVDIGYDSKYATRDYYARTNDTGQLVEVVADKIIIQNDDKEPEQGDGRYCKDEAKVPGTESPTLDEGHVIADSLGGVSNAYNITPQESNLNRHGVQADFEEEIRENGGATDFKATIEYPDSKDMTPSTYHVSYKLNGKQKSYDFDNK